jgi:HAE1 family hydrophobic/amphiphilic exporter-1
MTTMSIFASLAPVALGAEAGSELLRAAALVLIGGLLTSTLLTLVFVPAMFTLFDDVQELILRAVRRVAKPRVMQPAELAFLGAQPSSTLGGDGGPSPRTVRVGPGER